MSGVPSATQITKAQEQDIQKNLADPALRKIAQEMLTKDPQDEIDKAASHKRKEIIFALAATAMVLLAIGGGIAAYRAGLRPADLKQMSVNEIVSLAAIGVGIVTFAVLAGKQGSKRREANKRVEQIDGELNTLLDEAREQHALEESHDTETTRARLERAVEETQQADLRALLDRLPKTVEEEFEEGMIVVKKDEGL